MNGRPTVTARLVSNGLAQLITDCVSGRREMFLTVSRLLL